MRNTRNYLVVHSVVDGPYIADPPTPPTPVTHTVTLTPGEGYTAAFVAGSSSPALAGSSVYFTVIPAEGYETTSVTDGTNTLNPVNGVYTISEIDADTTIVVEATPVTHTVTFAGDTDYYTAAFVAGSSSQALAGSTVNFTVVAHGGYVITRVDDGITAVTAVNGVYTISEIAADTTIFVSAAETPPPPAPVTHTVTLTEGKSHTAAFVAGSSGNAVAGSVVNFTVVATEGYEIIEVTDGTNTLTGVNDVYTINGIAADTTIFVSAAETPPPPAPVTYSVKLPAGTGYTAAFVAGSSELSVAGSDVNFTVVPDDGHVITSVTDGTNTLTAVNGVYTINVYADTVIEVVAVLLPTHTVTLPEDTGYTAAFVAGSSSPAVAGSVVNFTVAATEGYEITSVSDGTNTLTPVNGVYTINAIAADITIRVDAQSIGG